MGGVWESGRDYDCEHHRGLTSVYNAGMANFVLTYPFFAQYDHHLLSILKLTIGALSYPYFWFSTRIQLLLLNNLSRSFYWACTAHDRYSRQSNSRS